VKSVINLMKTLTERNFEQCAVCELNKRAKEAALLERPSDASARARLEEFRLDARVAREERSTSCLSRTWLDVLPVPDESWTSWEDRM